MATPGDLGKGGEGRLRFGLLRFCPRACFSVNESVFLSTSLRFTCLRFANKSTFLSTSLPSSQITSQREEKHLKSVLSSIPGNVFERYLESVLSNMPGEAYILRMFEVLGVCFSWVGARGRALIEVGNV